MTAWSRLDPDRLTPDRRPRRLPRWFVPTALMAAAAGALVGLTIVRARAANTPTVGPTVVTDATPASRPVPGSDLANPLAVIKGDSRKIPDAHRLDKNRRCTARQTARGAWLPDPVCSPGAVSDRVTQDNIASTICRPGYTTKVRPTSSTMDPVRRQLIAAYGHDLATFKGELDHVVPLTLGGANSVTNLAPQAGPVPNDKDTVERMLARYVCAHHLTLAEAQHRIAADWTTALHDLPTALMPDTVRIPDLDTEPDPTPTTTGAPK